MWVEAILSGADLSSLLGEVLPLTIHLGESDSDDAHYIEVSSASSVSLVADRGLRVTCGARVSWPLLGIHLPITLNSITFLLIPISVGSPASDGEALQLKLEIEEADLAGVPAMLEHPLIDVINHRLAAKKEAIAWKFSETLSHVFRLPHALHPLQGLDLQVAWGKCRITEEAVVLAVSFHCHAIRHSIPEPLAVTAPHSNGLRRSSRARRDHVTELVLLGGAGLAAFGVFAAARALVRQLSD